MKPIRLYAQLGAMILLAAIGLKVSASLNHEPTPVRLLKQVSHEMTQTLDRHQGRIKDDKPFLENVIRTKLVPHFTVSTMARSVVGRSAWSSATPAQKAQFKKEFAEMVIGIYAAPLAQYDGDKIQFYPLRTDISKATRIQVNSMIIRKTGQKIPVNYRMVKIGSDWKVYDFSIEGISMVQSYRSQFSSVLRQQGFAGLLRKVASHNRNV